MSLIIPVHNGYATLAECLGAACASSFDSYEVIVVDDGSTDGSAELAERYHCHVVRLASQGGAARARNAGAAEAGAPILLFTDADVVLPADALERVWDDFARRPDVAAVQGIYRCPGRYDNAASRYQNDYYHYFCRRIKGDYTSVFATWCAAVKADAFHDSGGFDCRIAGATVEDEELGYELIERGHRIFLDRNLLVEHLACYNGPTLLRRRFRMARSQIKSAFRKAPLRLFRRYANLGHNLTHHSRKTLAAIPVSFALPVVAAWAMVARQIVPAALCLATVLLLVALAAEFLRHVADTHGPGAVVTTLALFWLDMLAIGLGLAVGALEYAMGRRF
jgi:GT2 family glycosyltransferase